MEHFTAAFSATTGILAYLAGVAVAILIPALALLVVLGVFAWCFDRITTAIGRHWHKRGKHPRGRIGQIIYRRTGDV